MAVDFHTKLGRERLVKAMEASNRTLRPFRDTRERLIAAYEGDQYGGESTSKVTYKVIANVIQQLADVYVHLLASTRPRARISTKHPELKPYAYKFTQSVNTLLEEIHFEETLRRLVLDAFFGMGVAKICMGDSGKGFLQDDIWYDPGRPYVSAVSLDDFIYDTKANHWNKMLYAADTYKTCRDYLDTDPRVNRKVLSKVPRGRSWSRTAGDDGHSEYVSAHTADDDMNDEDAAEMIQLIDVWLPTEAKVVTWAYHGHSFERIKDSEPLMVNDWEGPEEGPYERLAFTDVPDNIFPISPASTIEHLNRIYNNLLVKLTNQAAREKKVGMYDPTEIDLAKSLKDAKDGELIKGPRGLPQGQAFAEITVGGASQIGQGFAIQLKNILDAQAGNLPAMAGLGPQTDTVGQDAMIHASVSKREATLQKITTRFVEKVITRVACLMWEDGVNSYESYDTLPELGLTFDNSMRPNDREGSFFQYNFTVEPYSMVTQSPQQRAHALMGMVGNFYLPIMPLIQQQGGQIDVTALNEMFAEMMDHPELREIVRFDGQSGPNDSIITEGEGGPKPQSSRTYNHVNSSRGQSYESQQEGMMQDIMKGANAQPA